MLVVAVLGIQFELTVPVISWFKASVLFRIVTMLAAMAFVKQHGLLAIIGALFARIVVGRLFGILRMAGGENSINTAHARRDRPWRAVDHVDRHRSSNGLDAVSSASFAHIPAIRLVLRPRMRHGVYVLVRNYVGMIFSDHIFAGPASFAIFEGDLGSIDPKPAAAMAVLTGVSKMIAGIGLYLVLYTRFAALIGATFLYVSTLWGNQFSCEPHLDYSERRMRLPQLLRQRLRHVSSCWVAE